MISTTTRIRIKNILNRIESKQVVTLEERIFLNKSASLSKLISDWVTSALGPEANSIDNDNLLILSSMCVISCFELYIANTIVGLRNLPPNKQCLHASLYT